MSIVIQGWPGFPAISWIFTNPPAIISNRLFHIIVMATTLGITCKDKQFPEHNTIDWKLDFKSIFHPEDIILVVSYVDHLILSYGYYPPPLKSTSNL